MYTSSYLLKNSFVVSIFSDPASTTYTSARDILYLTTLIESIPECLVFNVQIVLADYVLYTLGFGLDLVLIFQWTTLSWFSLPMQWPLIALNTCASSIVWKVTKVAYKWMLLKAITDRLGLSQCTAVSFQEFWKNLFKGVPLLMRLFGCQKDIWKTYNRLQDYAKLVDLPFPKRFQTWKWYVTCFLLAEPKRMVWSIYAFNKLWSTY